MPAGKEHFAEGFKNANVPSIPELVEMAQDLGVKVYCLSNDNGCDENVQKKTLLMASKLVEQLLS